VAGADKMRSNIKRGVNISKKQAMGSTPTSFVRKILIFPKPLKMTVVWYRHRYGCVLVLQGAAKANYVPGLGLLLKQ
jgi:hypothetical protein